MILENKGEAFTMKYSSKFFDIPAGKFEITDAIGNHLVSRADFWGKDIVVVEGPKKDIIQNQVTPEAKPVEEAPKEEAPKAEAPKGKDKK